MRGRRNPDRAQSNMLLPPCRVCGEKGSGFHYGVTTCGACKGFFRRSLVRNEPYVCMKSHLCKVGPSTSRRQSCPKCRYDKCISVGMSKDACKVGRYSLVKKSKDIAEMLKYQMDRPGEEGFTIDKAVFEKSASLSKLTPDPRDNDLNSTGTVSSAPCSPGYSELPAMHPRTFGGKDYAEKPEILRSSSCFMQESERVRESYCDMTHYNSEDTVYSDIETEDVYPSYHMNGQNSFGSGSIYSKPETYPPAYQTGVTSSSFLEASPVMMDSFTQELETPAFDPLFARSQESNYTVLQAANLPQYTSTPNPSLISEPLMPLSISSSASGSNLDRPGHESRGPILTAHRPAFEQPNIPSTFCASPLVNSPSSSCDFRLDSATTPENHRCHEIAMSENRNPCNPEFACQVSTPFVSSSTQLSSHSMSYNHQATHSAPATPRHHLSGDPVIYSTPTSVYPPRDYSIDELIAQSIHTEAWSDQNWTSGSLDQRSRHLGSAMTHASVNKPGSHVQTTQSSWVDFKSSAPSVPDRGPVIAPQSTKLIPEDYTTSPATTCVASFLSGKPDHFLEVKGSEKEKTELKLESIVETRSETETGDDANVSKPQCLEIARKDNKRRYDEMCDDDTSVISPTTGAPSSFFLLFICPELAPYGLAMYEQFPFASYEQQCLKPFLNSCVDTGDALKSSLAADANVGCLEIMPDSEITQCLSADTDLAPLSKAAEPISNLGSLLDGEGKFQMNFCDQDLDLTLSSLMEAHDRTVGLETNSMTDMEIKTAQDVYRGLCKLRDRLHGPMQFIDKDVYDKVFVSTGVDVDKRREYIGLYASLFNHNLPKAIRFFRSVPGFQALSMADRIVLAKAALHEYCLLSSYKGTDQQNEIVINLEYMLAMRMSVLEKAFPEVALTRRQAHRLTIQLKALKLTKEELVLIKAICLTQPQREEQLQDPMLAERLHQKLLGCLMNYLRKNHLKPEERYADLANVLREINFVGSMTQQVIKDNQDYYLRLLKKLPVNLCTETIFGSRSSDSKTIESKMEENRIQELT